MLNRATFFKNVKPLFKRLSKTQVLGIEGIIDAFEDVGDGKIQTLAYALATSYHETGKRMVPVREGFAKTDAGARKAVTSLAVKRGPKSAVSQYAKPVGPYDNVYYGRGYVQLTWLDNYKSSSKDAGVDLVRNPDAMLDPVISARVLIIGLLDGRWNGRKKGLASYLPNDPVQARRTVNVLDKADVIAGYYKHFLYALTVSQEVVNTTVSQGLSERVSIKPAEVSIVGIVGSWFKVIAQYLNR